jgi:hypothetical protein
VAEASRTAVAKEEKVTIDQNSRGKAGENHSGPRTRVPEASAEDVKSVLNFRMLVQL